MQRHHCTKDMQGKPAMPYRSGQADQLKLPFLSYEDDPALRSFLHLPRDSRTRARRQRALTRVDETARSRGRLFITEFQVVADRLRERDR